MTVSYIRCQSTGPSFVGPGRVEHAFKLGGTAAEPGTALALLPARLAERRGPHQRLPRVRPPVRVRLPRVVLPQPRAQPPLELGRAGEVPALEEAPRQHAEE